MRLRGDVEVQLEKEKGRLFDKLFGRDITLGPISTDVVRHLDGRSLDELTAATGYPREDVEDALRTLLLLNLVDGAGAAEVARARALKAGEPLGKIILAESRFGCVGSGDCCQSYHFGPLTDEDIARLESLDLKSAFPHLEPPYWYERELPNTDKKGRFLTAVDNRCIFLEGCRCGLHAKLGYASKPGLCRYYPFEPFATLDGIQLYDKGGCSEFATTARSGATLKEQLEELWPLMPQQPIVHHPVVLMGANTPADFGYLQPHLRAAVDELERPPASSPEMLRAYARRVRKMTEALRRCALEPDGPRRAIDGVMAQPLDLLPPSAEALREGANALSRLVDELSLGVTLIISEEHQMSAEFYSGRQSKELLPILQLLGEIAAHKADPAFALSEYAREVASVSVEDPGIDDVLRLSLRNQLFGHGAVVDDRVVPGELKLAMVQLLSLWGARLRAVADGRARAVPEDLSRPHMLAMRVQSWGAVRRVFLDEEAELTPLLEALPELAHA